jgi:hypothetical protein
MSHLAFAKEIYSINRNLDELIELVATWKFVFQDPLNEYTIPLRINEKTLFIECLSGSMMDLLAYKQHIINSVNIFFAKTLIDNIVFFPKM